MFMDTPDLFIIIGKITSNLFDTNIDKNEKD